jgi:hypothetical protein
MIPRLILHFFTHSYTNYARLVIFSLAFPKTFNRGSEAESEVFFTSVRVVSRSQNSPYLTRREESGKRHGRRHNSC